MLLATSVHAQELSITTNKKGKVGFADRNGNVVIKCQYESALPFTDGISIVTKSGKQGMIDESGRTLVKTSYDKVAPWGEGLFLLQKGKKFGLSDRNGKLVLKLKYTHISDPNCYQKAWVSKDGKLKKHYSKSYMNGAKLGIIDARGTELVAPKYKGIFEFSKDAQAEPFHEGKMLNNSYLFVEDTLMTDCSFLGFNKEDDETEGAGLMDGMGKELVKIGTYDHILKPENDMARYYHYKKKHTEYGYINVRTGKKLEIGKVKSRIANMNEFTHGDFRGETALVHGTEWAFIDRDGKAVRSGYKDFRNDKVSGYWVGQNAKGVFEVYNEKCDPVPALYGSDDILFPKTTDDKLVFGVKRQGKYGILDATGNVLLPFEYDAMSANELDFMTVVKGDKCGVFSATDGLVVPVRFTQHINASERNAKHFWVRQTDSLYYHFDVAKQKLGPKGYKYISSNFTDGIALAMPPKVALEDSPINRAQLYEPNTKEAIRAVDAQKDIEYFGYIINTDDQELMDLPVSLLYVQRVLDELKKYGDKPITPWIKKNILLEVTQPNRSYDLNSVISESEWNY